MCNVCGCGTGATRVDAGAIPDKARRHHHHGGAEEDAGSRMAVHEHGHDHDHGHAQDPTHAAAGDLHFGLGPAHAHAPGLSQQRMVRIEQDILARNNTCADANRRWFGEHGVFAINLVSSPGSGKTSLLVRTIEALHGTLPLAVIEGDQQTARDADRIRAAGAPALQINTGKGCHLDAAMLGPAIGHLVPADDSLLLIENVGNLVCPAGFDLGEAHKVVVLSVTEGEDKPLKYPDMFHAVDLMLLNKIDLLPHLHFDVAQCIANARRINPGLEVIELSAESGAGLPAWLDWLRRGAVAARQQRLQNVAALQRRIAALEAQLAAKG
jgi:hydrogenase nickel incorporation protein HypB